MYAMSAFTTFVTLSIVGGWPFVVAAIVIGSLYYQGMWLCVFTLQRILTS